MIWFVTQLAIGLVILGVGAELMVKGSVRLAAIFGIPSLLIGLTIVAFGTSAPELAVSLISSYKGQADIAVGNVIGSNILNILFVIGISALIKPLSVHLKIVKLEIPVLILVSGLSLYFALDAKIGRMDGLILFLFLVFYLTFQGYLAKRAPKDESLDPEIEKLVDESIKDPKQNKKIFVSSLFIVIGIGALVWGSSLFVDGASGIARYFGVSELLIGLTIVALGTSLPELATSVTAALKNENDIAIGNAIGSNIFNICAVLGLTGAISHSGLDVSLFALQFDFPVMLIVTILILPILFAGFCVTRLEGFLFIALYFLYVGYLVVRGIGNEAIGTYTNVTLKIALPLIGIAFAGSFIKNIWSSLKSRLK